MQRVQFAFLNMFLPEGWVDITGSERSSVPTLAIDGNGVGVLQFSVARYEAGKMPNFLTDDLKQLLYEFEDKHNFVRKQGVIVFSYDRVNGIKSDYKRNGDFFRIWYLTDGTNLALVTYSARGESSIAIENELAESDEIVQSIEF